MGIHSIVITLNYIAYPFVTLNPINIPVSVNVNAINNNKMNNINDKNKMEFDRSTLSRDSAWLINSLSVYWKNC